MMHTILYSPTLGFPLNILLPDFHIPGNLPTIAIMQEKQQSNLFEVEYHSIVLQVAKINKHICWWHPLSNFCVLITLPNGTHENFKWWKTLHDGNILPEIYLMQQSAAKRLCLLQLSSHCKTLPGKDFPSATVCIFLNRVKGLFSSALTNLKGGICQW